MGHEDTIVLGNGYLDKPRKTLAREISEEDTVSTRIISSQELTVDGAPFQWWAVGDRPALVTVRSRIFGSRAEFTRGDRMTFAETLAKKLLAEHYERAATLRKPAQKEPAPEPSEQALDAMKKAGWFEV